MLSIENSTPELYVTNFHRRITGVSSTADALVSKQQNLYNMKVVGFPLPSANASVTYRFALSQCKKPPQRKSFAIWHVRRNLEIASAIFARDYLRYPIRIVFTSAAKRFHSAVPRALIRRVDAVVATTPEAATYVPNLASVIPHGVDTQLFTPAADRAIAWRELGLPGKFGIGIVGRIRYEKGTDCFVDAMCSALQQRPDFTAVIIGRSRPADEGFHNKLKQVIEFNGLANRILFLGEKSRAELPQIIRSLSLLVASPRYEGFGMTPLEAMASGVAVVATDTGVYRQIINEGQTGLVVGIDDLTALTDAIMKITSDPDDLHRMGCSARQVAMTKHSLEREVDAYAEVYERLWNGEIFRG